VGSIALVVAGTAGALVTLAMLFLWSASIQDVNFAAAVPASTVQEEDVSAFGSAVTSVELTEALIYAGDADVSTVRALSQTAVVLQFLPWLLTCLAAVVLARRWAHGTVLARTTDAGLAALAGTFLLAGAVAPWLAHRAQETFLTALALPRTITEAEQAGAKYFFPEGPVELGWITLAPALVSLLASWAAREARLLSHEVDGLV